MIKNIFILVFGMLVSTSAMAQNFGALGGFHQTTADVEGGSDDGKLGFKAGAVVSFDLMEGSLFRSGLIFNQRHFGYETTLGDFDVKFDYLDIPALYQHSFNEMVSAFGGIVIGMNVSDKVEAPAAAGSIDADADTLVPFLTAGVNFLFDDMFGFDFYFERGIGDAAEGVSDYTTFGANFLYWF